MISKKRSFKDNASSNTQDLPKHIMKNRKFLAEIMEAAGFTNYEREYWHWCYGDYLWAKINKKDTAIYGIINNKV